MEAKQCPKGHYYDSAKFSTCPVCQAAEADTPGETMPIGGTMPLNVDGYAPIPPTEAVENHNAADDIGYQNLGKTMPLSANAGGFSPAYEEYGATMPHDEAVLGFIPTVGWVICISGPHKGKDFHLVTGYNKIGRSPEMAICLPDDDQITRDSHAVIAYEPQGRKFFAAGDKNMIYLNGSFVMGAQELHANDVIKLGASELMFVPLCGEAFSWE